MSNELNPMAQTQVAIVSTSSYAVNAFLALHINALTESGAEITVYCNRDHGSLNQDLIATHDEINFSREINLLNDLYCLILLYFKFRNKRYDEIYTISPKAGLIGVLAASLSKIPHRMHFFTGQVWSGSSGVRKILLKSIDKLIGYLISYAIVDSPSQRDFLLSEDIIKKEKAIVFGHGSMCGVDTNRFKPNARTRKSIRSQYGVKDEDFIVLFVGRLTLDKGLIELANAFSRLKYKHDELNLFLVGADEGIRSELENIFREENILESVKFLGQQVEIEKFFAAADIFCLPSYREGFGLVLIEAAASGVPSVASRIYGITDAVVDNKTGLLHTPKSVEDLYQKLEYLIESDEERSRLSKNARKYAIEKFHPSKIKTEFLDFRERKINR
ncbi:glycosyltransferase family 4 protein [Planktomarina temperata]|nr:glycosyltransferase family 4 protein [Planktomarina temperata]